MDELISGLPMIRDIMQVMHSRMAFFDALPDELCAVSEAQLDDGWPIGDRIWYRFFVGKSSYVYAACARGQVSASELYLLKIALQSLRTDLSGRSVPTWRKKIQLVLQAPIEPFAGPIRIEDEIESIAVPWAWPIFAVGIWPSDARSAAHITEIQSTFRSLTDIADLRPYVAAEASAIIAIFSPLEPERELTESIGEETARALVDGLVSEAFWDVRAVWSPVLRSFPELLQTLKRMIYVAHAAEGLRDEQRVLSIRGLGVYELLYATKPQFRQAFADHILPASAIATLGAELEQTVMMFVECDLNMSETARRLYLHRNSLLYRLERIRDLTGYDIRRFEDAVTVWTALLLRRM